MAVVWRETKEEEEEEEEIVIRSGEGTRESRERL